MLPEPLRHGLGRPIREQGDRLVALQIHEDGAIGVPFPQGEIVYPEHRGVGSGQRQLPEQAQEGVPAYHQVPLVAKLHPGCTPQGHAEGAQAVGQPQGAPGPGAATVGRRSVKIRRRQARLRQNHLRTRS